MFRINLFFLSIGFLLLGCQSRIEVEILGKAIKKGKAASIFISAPEKNSTNFQGTNTYTVTYSEVNSVNLTVSDIEVFKTGTADCNSINLGSLNALAKEVLFSECSGEGTISIQIKPGTGTDLEGKSLGSSNLSSSFEVDNTAPLVDIGTPSSNTLNSFSSTTFELIYEEVPSGLVNSNITINGDSADCTAVISDSATLTPDVTVSGCSVAAGTITISVAGGRSTDSAGNPDLGAGPSDPVTIDNTPPTVTIGSPIPSLINSTTATVFELTYEELPSGLINSDITINGDSADCVALVSDNATLTPDVTISGCSVASGTITISVAGGRSSDGLGNPDLGAGPSDPVTIDNTPPTVTIGIPTPNLINATTATVFELTYEELPSGLINSDITINGDSADCSAVVSDNATLTPDVTISGCSVAAGTITISVAGGRSSDGLGNPDLGAGPSASATIDNTPPTVTIGSPIPSLINATTATVFELTYEELPSGLINSDITINGDSADCVPVVSDNATLTPDVTVSGCSVAAGTITISVAGGRSTDSAGNLDLGAGPSDPVTIDNTPPTITIGSPIPSVINSTTATVFELTYEELPSGLVNSDITINGDSADCSAVVSDNATLSPDVTVSGCSVASGTITISVAGGRSSDGLGNPDLGAGPSASATIDNTPPTVTIGSPIPSIINSITATVFELTYEEVPSGLVNNDITINGDSADCVPVVSDNATLTPDVTVSGCSVASGTITISVAGGRSVDSAGNPDLGAGPSASATIDNTPPTVTIGSPIPSVINATTATVFELTYEEVPSGLVNNDITINGDSADCVPVVSDNATLTPDVTVSGCSVASGTITISVAGGRSTDSAGNPDLGAGPSDPVTIDNTLPTVTIGSPIPSLINATIATVFELTYEEVPSGLVNNDITINGDSSDCSAVVSDNATLTPDVTVSGCSVASGTITISVAGGRSIDSAGNFDLGAGPSASATIDNTPPTVTIGSPIPSVINSTTATVFELTYEEVPSGLVNNDITINGDSADCVALVSDNATLTPDVTVSGCSVASGTITISVTGGRSIDSAGNADLGAGPSDSVTISNAPTVTFSSINANAMNSTDFINFNLTLSFAPSVALNATDVTFNGTSAGCSVSGVTGGTTTTPVVTVTGCSGVGDMSINVYSQGPSQTVFVTQKAPMEIVVRTVNPNETFTLPFRNTFIYDAYVQWGDSSYDRITSFNQIETVHSYANGGDHSIRIYGTAQAWFFNNTGDKDKIIAVNQLGELDWRSFRVAFQGCSNLTTFTPGTTDTSNVVSMYGMFNDAVNLTSLDLSSFDSSLVTSTFGMFLRTNSLTSLNLSNFNTASVVEMDYMFQQASSLSSLNLSSFNTSSVTNMRYMLSMIPNLTTLDISSFDTSNVSDMEGMFHQARNLTALDLNGFNTSKVSTMVIMFQEVDNISSLNLSAFNTSNVTSMEGMFNRATSLTELNLSNFNTSQVTSTRLMFGNTASMTNIILTGVDTSAVNNMEAMFNLNSSLTALDLTGFNTSNVTTMRLLLGNLPNVQSVDLSSFDTSNVSDMEGMFNVSTGFADLNLSNFDTSNVTTFRYMFSLADGLTNIDLSSFDTSKATSMEGMFNDLNGLTALDLSNFNTSLVTNVDTMFINGSGLSALNLTNWDTQPNPSSVNWIGGTNLTGKIYCNDPDSGGTGTDGTGSVIGEGCASLDSDSDNDGISDFMEVILGFNPLLPESDQDGDKVPDGFDSTPSGGFVDSDGDGVSDDLENLVASRVPRYSSDFDSDGIPDASDPNPFFGVPPDSPMITKWKVGTGGFGDGDNSITLPFRPGNTYNVNVDWGDGSPIQNISTSSWVPAESTHEYPGPGDYTVTINGTAPTWSFNNSGDLGKLIEVNQLGALGWRSFRLGFYGCTNLTSFTPGLSDTSNVTTFYGTFGDTMALTSLDLSSLKTGSVTDMTAAFIRMSNLTSLNLSGWNTSNVILFDNMFEQVNSLPSLNLQSFNTSNATSMSLMFNQVQGVTSLNLSNFNTSNVRNLNGLFNRVTLVQEIDLSSFNTSNVTNMKTMFKEMRSVTDIKLGSFDTSNVGSMEGMFRAADSLTNIDLRHFDTSNVTTMKLMFDLAGGFTALDLSTFNTSKVTDLSNAFSFDLTNVPSIPSSFQALNLTYWDTLPLPLSTDWLKDNGGITNNIYCNDADAGGTGIDGAGTINTTTNCAALNDDFDNDGISDFMEIVLGFDPNQDQTDSDNDGVPDLYDDTPNGGFVDSDNDGLSDDLESLVASRVPRYSEDFDSDGVADNLDPNPFVPNTGQAPMVSRWRVGTTGFGDASLSIVLPFQSGYTYNVVVDWGDGTNAQTISTSSWTPAQTTHNYTNPGDYTVSIYGTLPAWSFNNSGDKDKLIAIDQLGEVGWSNFKEAFWGCSNLTTFNVGKVNTSLVTDMRGMFLNATGITELDLVSFNTSNVTHMGQMFEGTNLTQLDISSFNTPLVTDMSSMFKNLSGLNVLDLSNFQTPTLSLMSSMFENATSIQALNLTNWNTSQNPTATSWNLSMSGTIYCNDPDNGGTGADGTGTILGVACNSLDNDGDNDGLSDFIEIVLGFDPLLDEQDLDNDKVPDTYDSYPTGGNTDSDGDGLSDDLEQLVGAIAPRYRNDFDSDGTPDADDLNPFSISLNYPPDAMITKWRVGTPDYGDGDKSITLPLLSGFAYNFTVDWGDGTPVQTINTSSWVEADSTHVYADAGDYTVVIQGSLSLWYFNNIAGRDMGKLISVEQFGDLNYQNLWGAFNGCSNLTKFISGGGVVSGVTDMRYMFQNTSNLTSIDLSSFNTSNVQNMLQIFANAYNITSLDVSGFDTSNVTNMQSMFLNVQKPTLIDVSGFNTTSAANMFQMFTNTFNNTNLDVSGFNTSLVTDMRGMFQGTSNITVLDVSGFNTSLVTDMRGMFQGTSNITVLDVSGFNTSSVTDFGYMFTNNPNITTLNVTGFNTSNAKDMKRMFSSVSNVQTLDVSGFTTSLVTDMEGMFYETSNATVLDVAGFSTNQVSDMSWMFYQNIVRQA